MNLNIKYITVLIVGLIVCFFIGRWTAPVENKVIKVTIPETSGKSPIINNPKPLIQVKDSLIYKDSLIVTENPFNKDLANKYISLESETERLKQYIKSIELRKYEVPFENDTIKIIGNVEVQGELKSLKYNWFIKQRIYDIPVEIKKPTINLLLGGSVSNTVDLNKFNINANLGIQRKNGDLIITSYGVFDKSIQLGYLVNMKL